MYMCISLHLILQSGGCFDSIDAFTVSPQIDQRASKKFVDGHLFQKDNQLENIVKEDNEETEIELRGEFK